MTTINEITRGKHILPHQSQILTRDLHGEDIMNNRGKDCLCFILPDSEVEKRKTSGPFLPYKYIVYYPGRPYENWTAFYTIEELNDFCAAYGLCYFPRVKSDMENNDSFIIRIPENPVFLPTNLPAKLFVSLLR